ncbi:uncharacterized protein Z520_08314 [Fonsecaea multimorphosa CBS 102226]|uniref:FAD-binding domain-containing protein n=1 Tax=Fonsecaea multimorphosa CBS 102226 TaxID=1442371 RepID=A0A0D2JZM7_9EURO|nr:uncharacterized protein Z520_08314 [Fonsecaea multimorphosa CBS 102226]KIX96059.1 hypothetical protein Z520_08314 [Fonsecaea multimorphosa CBS 102226]OAL21825.1 hypothetical protein AYO22_07767 [Fonsecaea multimorphosa]
MAVLRVGIVGAGIGGLAAAIAIARSGCSVTILEQGAEIGEIGAGIQLHPNVSRQIIRWGVDKIIENDLVAPEALNTWDCGSELRLVARTDPKQVARQAGFPWWVVRRDHLYNGLAQSASEHGVKLIIQARVEQIDDTSTPVRVVTSSGQKYEFDLLVGADGLKSTVRQYLYPGVMPYAPNKLCAYRGVLPFSLIYKEIPEASLFLGNRLDTWVGAKGYVLTYPTSGGKELNVVTAAESKDYVTKMEDIDVEEFYGFYADFHPFVRKLLHLVKYTKRWPLLQTPRLPSWSNKAKNIVMIGDAVHAMQNHMAQGAGTAIEDGAFLGQVISEVVRGVISVPEAVTLFEQRRMPKAWIKQQLSFHSGLMYTVAQPEEREKRNQAGRFEVARWEHNPARQEPSHIEYRSWPVARCVETAKSIWYYDPEGDADNAVLEYLMSRGKVDDFTQLSENLGRKWSSIVSGNGVDGSWVEPQVDYQHMKNSLYRGNGAAKDGIREYGLHEQDYDRFGKGL